MSPEWKTGTVKLSVSGIPMEFEMTVPAAPVKPNRMLPIFHQMANAFVDVGVQAVESTGDKISCKAGCGACCRQPVPIAEIEVYQIAELVESMPEPRRSIVKQRFADGVEHFRRIGWFDKMNSQYEGGKAKESETAVREAIDVVLEYFYEGVPCPFLENEACSIHESRPVACREYLVTTPAEFCSKPTAETVNVIDLLIKPSRSMRKLGATNKLDDAGLLTLIRALELAERTPETFAEKSGQDWMADYFGVLTNSDIPSKPDSEPAESPAPRS